MNKRITTILFVALAVLTTLGGCIDKPKGSGEDTRLFVIADSTNWVALEPTMREVFERIIQTPQPEAVFGVYWVPPRQFNQFATRKNLVIAGVIDSDGEIDEKIDRMLSSEVKSRVNDGSAFVFPKENPWAENQLLLVLVSNGLEELQAKMLEHKDMVYDFFHKRLIDATVASMYEYYEQHDIAEKFLQENGWTLRVQHDYFVNTERVQDRFVMLRRSLPNFERWLFVHWLDDANPELITEEWAINMRNRLTEKFMSGDYIDEERTSSVEVEFANRPALKLIGLWANDENVSGGPFRSYTFYDATTQRVYMIDYAVFYPGGEKEPFLRQLDVMARTFKTRAETSDKKEES